MNAKEKYVLNPRDAVVWNAAIKAAAEVCEKFAGSVEAEGDIAFESGCTTGANECRKDILALLDTEGGGDE